MEKTNKVVQFGEYVAGYNIPVLNEREIRASAGILFLFMLISMAVVISTGNFLMLKYVVTIFLADFIVRILVNPRYAPLLIIGRLIVSKQVPEYVGAPQKRFAWLIGLSLSTIMFTLLIVVNSYSEITGIICLLCLVFLFFESAFGICIGCKFYGWIYKEKAQYCPGEICDVKSKHTIQKTSGLQLLMVFGLILFILALVFLFNDTLSEAPKSLWEMLGNKSIE